MKTHAGRAGALVAAIAAAVFCLTSPAYGQDFSVTGSLDGHPIDATAHFVTGVDSVSVTLTNLSANPVSIIQAISDIFFTATQGGVALTSGTGFKTPSASYIAIAANGTSSAAAVPVNNWLLTNTSGTYHLDALCGPPPQCGGPSGLIIGPGPYTNANGSIAANGPHNPFIDQTATFTLALLGATAATVISDVVFSFGTDGVTVPGTVVPIPAAVWLFVSGLLGLIGIARRKQAGTRNALPMAA
jgi:hypothetical protein